MRVIVSGPSSLDDPVLVARALARSGWAVTELVGGAPTGVEAAAARWAERHGVPLRRFDPADYRERAWQPNAERANRRRLAAMIPAAEAVVLVWDGLDHWSRLLLTLADAARLPVLRVYVHEDAPETYYFPAEARAVP